ncbi:helix-turn-helix domain-containing protein [Sphingopyxis sp. JAI108]|uniref:helix-turn-helix domain-containing protein n=1 Tax=Sphingopyxis sp. JAI108 TaxID=2723060 RepID=UPI0015CD7430|nr:excisionase family DNA binding protein [Sphingopyxis sp. JAI108]
MKPYSTPEKLPCPAYLPVEPVSVRIPTAVKLTGLSRSTIYNLIRSGDLDTAKVGSVTLIPVDSLRRFVDSRRIKSE